MTPNIVAVIQARMGSSRLPNKVLLDLSGRSVLARVCRRAARASLIDRVVVATTASPDDEPIVDECRALGIDVTRGSEEDVLDRYVQAATEYRADVVVRITSDCPLIDPGVVDLVVAAFLRSGADYASNTLERTWPRGLDTEVFSRAGLQRIGRDAAERYQRVHVTPYFYQNPELFRLLPVVGPHDLGGMRWTVDYPEDLELVRRMFGYFDGRDDFDWEEALGLVRRHPELLALNADKHQKQLTEC